MSTKKILAGVALLLIASASQAGVIYQWVTVGNPMPVNTIRISIEIEESTVRGGSFNLSVGPGIQTIPNTGLVGFHFFESSATPTQWLPTDLGYLYMDLKFVHTNFYLGGSFHASDFTTKISASSFTLNDSSLPLWRINYLNGDGVLGCSNDPKGFCEGATGYFRQVPEPASLALFALGTLGLVALRRRKDNPGADNR